MVALLKSADLFSWYLEYEAYMVKGVRIASLDFIGEPSLSSHLLPVALEVIGLLKLYKK